MSTSITVLHVHRHTPEEVEHALAAVFAREERARALRLEGTYPAVLARAIDPELAASYAYVILRPHLAAQWTPALELGNRTEGLDVEISRLLGGCAVFTTFVYGDVVSGYRLARRGAEVDRYASDPTALHDTAQDAAERAEPSESEPPAPAQLEAWRGHPERFADLLPPGTAPEEFARVVLRPGWWDEHDAAATLAPAPGDDEAAMAAEDDDAEGIVDETDRMRCIGLALELWGPSEYPFAQDPEEIPNKVAGPAIAVAYA